MYITNDYRKNLRFLLTSLNSLCIIHSIDKLRNQPYYQSENAMTEKTVAKKPRLSKKVLIAEICEATGKAPKELDSLARANLETIAWVKNLVS